MSRQTEQFVVMLFSYDSVLGNKQVESSAPEFTPQRYPPCCLSSVCEQVQAFFLVNSILIHYKLDTMIGALHLCKRIAGLVEAID